MAKCAGPPTKVKTRMNIEENENRAENDESTTSESAFRGMINTRTWRVRGQTDPLSCLSKYHSALKRALIEIVTKNAVKFYLTVDITMVRKDKEGIKERTTTFFHGATRILLRASQIPEMLQASAEKINQSFDLIESNMFQYKSN